MAFYNKTGVSGPYMALASIGTFLASKEFFVMEHDFYVGISLAIVLTGKFIIQSKFVVLGSPMHICIFYLVYINI